MKTLLILLLPILALGQLQVDNGKIVWQSVQQGNETPQTVIEQMQRSGRFTDVELVNGSIIGNFNDADIDYRGYGKSTGSTSIYISSSNLAASFVVDFKESRRRIKVNNLKLVENAGLLNDSGAVTDLERFSVDRNGEMKKGFSKRDAPIFDYTLSNMFTFTTDNDW